MIRFSAALMAARSCGVTRAYSRWYCAFRSVMFSAYSVRRAPTSWVNAIRSDCGKAPAFTSLTSSASSRASISSDRPVRTRASDWVTSSGSFSCRIAWLMTWVPSLMILL